MSSPSELEKTFLSKLEKTFSVTIGHKRIIPGTVPVEGVENAYFCDGTAKGERFYYLTMHSGPLHAQRGNMYGVDCHLILPDGSIFHAVEYFADIVGWRQDIEAGAAEQKMPLARIEADKFVISDGRVFELSECIPEFD